MFANRGRCATARQTVERIMPKNIVICYDGTGNSFCENNTNVVKAFQGVVRDNVKQVAFYDPGVGTFSTLGRVLGRKVGILLGKAFGVGLQENLEDGYCYLMSHYEPGDKIFLFGFSRGAFQARALAGMLFRCGLLQRGAANLVPYVSDLYNQYRTTGRAKDGNGTIVAGFKETYCHECPVHLIAVWDTVESLGWFYGKRFFDANLNSSVSFAYHAMAIDERRKKFPVLPWNEAPEARHANQTVEQVWFAGVHSDVGGYYREHGLSDIALEWLLGKAEAQGLLLKEGWRKLISPCMECRADDTMHESYAGLWKLWRPVRRSIPEGAKVHRSVKQRKEAGIGYDPPNLPENVVWVA